MKKIILTILFLAIFSFLFNLNMPSVKAMTTTELQALILQLKQQIAQFQQQLAQAQIQANSVNWCHDFNTKLRIGDSGSEVSALKTALQKEGLLPEITNEFDEETASAVVAFQEKYKSEILTPLRLLHGTGYFGKATITKINSLYGCKTATSVPATIIPTPTATTTPTTSSTVPSITVTSPNGSVFIDGVPTQISWISTNVPAGSMVKIQIMGEANGDPESWGYSLGNYNNLTSGSISWTPRVLRQSGEKYHIKATLFASGTTKLNGTVLAISKSQTFTINLPQGVTRSLLVTSPSTDDTLQAGQTYTIKWQTSGIAPTDEIQLRYKSVGLGSELSGLGIATVTNSGSYQWTVPASLTSGQYRVEAVYINEYKIYGAIGDSGYFNVTVVAPTATPTLNILSPKAGDVWKFGEKNTISWTASNIIGNLTIYLRFPDSGMCKLADNVSPYGPSTGSYALTILENQACPNIPRNITAGQYKIDILSNDNPASSQGNTSSDSFSINSTTTFSVISNFTCTDSDNGRDYYTKGTVSGSDSSGNFSYTDYCVNSGLLKENFCLSYSPVTGLGGAAEEDYTCSNGCLEGACVE